MPVTKQDVLDYLRMGRPGKIEVVATKPLQTQRDLSLAYSPGVAEATLEVERDPDTAYELTAKGNLVAVVSNGTAILGLGNRGALAAKLGMEGKGLLFKRFADIDVFDIEINAWTPEEVIAVVRALEPTFGGTNLEDIKAPECSEVEETPGAEMNIPVFHDDQHGTAIIPGAGLLNALETTGKRIDPICVVISGAGASAVACGEFWIRLGVLRENISMVDKGLHLQRSRRSDEPVQSALCERNEGAHPCGCDQSRGRISRLVHREHADAGDGQDDGETTADLRARKS